MRSPFAFFSFAILFAACGGSTSDSSSGDDAGGDTTSGDAVLDSGTGTDSAGDTTPGGDSTVDTTPDVFADSGGGPCGAGGACGPGLKCCGNRCVNEQNDPLDCGGCGTTCSGETSMCLGGSCVKQTCSPACTGGQICCQVDGPGPSGPPRCEDGPTCPVGCPACG